MLNTDKLKQLKELLDMGAISQEEFDAQKITLLQEEKPKNKNVGLIAVITIVVIICFSIIFGGSSEGGETQEQLQTEEGVLVSPIPQEKTSVPEEFAGICPVGISSSMYDNIIGATEIKCTFKNNTGKEIAAIKLYFSPRNVYGEEVSTLFTTNELYTDDAIAAGESASKSWQLLDSDIKSGDLYVYSVYFSDGTEWGSKDASVSDIKKYAYKTETKY